VIKSRVRCFLSVALVTTLGVAGTILAYLAFAWPLSRVAAVPARPLVIAHAGGAVAGVRLTNSLEALNANYELGLRVFELDFSWTRSGELVAIHDWDHTFTRLFDGSDGPPRTAREFSGMQMRGGLTPLTLESLQAWLLERKDAYVVTDIKANNIAGLELISKAMPELVDRLIPQIYGPEEYDAVVSLGFARIIYTLYRSRMNPVKILRFVKRADLFAVTVPKARIAAFSIGWRINRLGKAVYAHTVNTTDEAQALAGQGATGFYSDSLRPPEVPADRRAN